MIERVLLAVDDSPAAIAAARLAVALCAGWSASLRAVTAVAATAEESTVDGREVAAARRAERVRGATALLRYVRRLAETAGVQVSTALLDGDAAPRVLDEYRHHSADLVVIGRSALGGTGQPYVGSQTRQVLEFADVPVLVVPPPVPAATNPT